MIIDFKNMQETAIPNLYDGEKDTIVKMFSDDDGLNNRILYAKLEPGASIGYHKHDSGSEIIYILDGEGKMLYEDAEEKLSAGDCHYCPKNHSHSLINESDSDLVFFAVVAQQ